MHWIVKIDEGNVNEAITYCVLTYFLSKDILEDNELYASEIMCWFYPHDM